MVALPKRLQAQSSCAHQSEQPMLLHGYKELKLQTGPLDPKALQVSFGLIIIKVRQMGLQMYCLVFFKETRMKKKSFGLRTLKFFIICSLHRQMPHYQVYPFWPAYCSYIRSLSAKLTLSHSSAGFGTCSKPN